MKKNIFEEKCWCTKMETFWICEVCVYCAMVTLFWTLYGS